MILEFLVFAAGLLVLVKGADMVVSSVSVIAKAFNIPGFIIGIFVVALGTSFPEAVIGIYSGFEKVNMLAVGDVVGSSIVNIALVIGITVMIAPILIDYQTIKLEIMLSILVQVILVVMVASSLRLSRLEAGILLGGMVGFVGFIVSKTRQISRKEFPDSPAELEIFELLEDEKVIVNHSDQKKAFHEWPLSRKNIEKARPEICCGLIAMVLGAKFAVDNAVAIASSLGVAKEIIGLTVVAFGTSLPEFVAGIIAVIKKEDDIAVGNIIGSNILNILFVLGLSGMINPITFTDPSIYEDLAAMIFASFLLLVPLWRSNRISKYWGFIYVSFYVLYIAYKVGAVF